MLEQPIRILLIENADSGAVALRDILGSIRNDLQLTVLEDFAELRQLLADSQFDVLLVDLDLPDQDGLNRVVSAKALAPYLPIVVLTNSGDETPSLSEIQREAQGHLVKSALRGPDLLLSLRNAVARKRAEEGRRSAEKLVHHLVDHSLVGVHVIQDGKFAYVNRELAEVFGYTEEELLALDSWTTLVAESDRGLVADQLRRRLSGDAISTHYVFQGRRKDGTIFDAEVHGSRTDLNGRPAAIGMVLDVTERRRDGERLRESEERFRNAFEHTNVAMVLTDMNHRFVRVNAAFARLFGYTEQEMLQMAMADITHPDDVAESYERRVRLVSGEVPYFQMEKRYFHKDGSLLWGLVNISLIRSARGEPQYYVGQVQDITERKQAEAELSKLASIVEGSDDAIIAQDLNETVISWNRAAERLFGYSAADAIGQQISSILVYNSSTPSVSVIERVKQGESIPSFETVRKHKNGTIVEVSERVSPIRDRQGKLVGVSVIYRDITERKHAEEKLRLRDRAIQAVTQGILITDPHQPDNPIIYASPSFETLTGYSASEALGRNCRLLQGKDTDPEAIGRLRKAIHQVQPCTVDLLNYKKDGTPFWNQLSISPVRDDFGRLTHFVGVQTDVTSRKTLEEQFRQSQKMEAIGQLAGGVAHDFNNLLTIIIGYSEIMLDSVGPEDSLRQLLEEINKAGKRSAALTRQLLAFSRKQVLSPTILNLNDVVRDTENMLQRVIGEDVVLASVLHPQVASVKADRGQLEQVLLNLAVNARDAMPHGGKLTIETKNVELDVAYAQTHAGVRPGSYVLLAVTDSGIGMTPDVVRRIFEPFFTTKEYGRGTGLGLAVVHGIVQQSEGCIEVYSEAGVGTSFKIYLPRFERSGSMTNSLQHPAATPPRGTETILLVEDEDALRALTLMVLQGCGYTMLEASNGDQALQIATDLSRSIDLLITDVVMPGGGGRVLSERIVALRPNIKVLYISGYTNDAVVRHGILHEQVSFLEKPFSPVDLANKVKEVLTKPLA